eukprot:RCo013496
MLERVITDILAKHVGEYVDGLEQDTLRIGLLKGDIRVQDLSLRRGALDALEIPLPFAICWGYVGALRIRVPWRQLRTMPIVVEIEQLYLLLKPKTTCSPEAAKKWVASEKASAIAGFE